MKKSFYQIAPLLMPVLAAALMSSCVESGYPGSYRVTASHGVYTVLPGNFVGSTYYYNGRYYSGGRYQSGRFHYQGRAYDNRYVYNGQYLYGGRYQQHGNDSPRYDRRRGHDDHHHSGYQSPAGYRRGGLYRIGTNPYR
jgi:hypothetical protein